MTEPNFESHTAGPDEKTTVLPETAVALVEMERLQGELAAAEERAKNHWEQYLRALAESTMCASVRPRISRARGNSRSKIRAGPDRGEGFAGACGRQCAEGTDKADVASLIEGEKATLRLLAKAFEKAQIEEVNPEGQPFNPEFHEAMMAQPSDCAAEHGALGDSARLPVERPTVAPGARDRVGTEGLMKGTNILP